MDLVQGQVDGFREQAATARREQEQALLKLEVCVGERGPDCGQATSKHGKQNARQGQVHRANTNTHLLLHTSGY